MAKRAWRSLLGLQPEKAARAVDAEYEARYEFKRIVRWQFIIGFLVGVPVGAGAVLMWLATLLVVEVEPTSTKPPTKAERQST